MFDRTCTQRNKSSPRGNWVTIERHSSRRLGEFPAYIASPGSLGTLNDSEVRCGTQPLFAQLPPRAATTDDPRNGSSRVPESSQEVATYSSHRLLEARSLAMHAVIARKIERDPTLLAIAHRNIERWSARRKDDPAPPTLLVSAAADVFPLNHEIRKLVRARVARDFKTSPT
jgi:hypothetical protein